MKGPLAVVKWHELVNRANVVITAVTTARFVPLGLAMGLWLLGAAADTAHRAHQCEYASTRRCRVTAARNATGLRWLALRARSAGVAQQPGRSTAVRRDYFTE